MGSTPSNSLSGCKNRMSEPSGFRQDVMLAPCRYTSSSEPFGWCRYTADGEQLYSQALHFSRLALETCHVIRSSRTDHNVCRMPIKRTCWQVVGAQAHLYKVPNLKALLAILYILEVEAPAVHQCT